jgi:hypothetical protein
MEDNNSNDNGTNDNNKLGYKIKNTHKRYKIKITNKFKLYKRTIMLVLLILLGVSISLDLNLSYRFKYDVNYPNMHELIFETTDTDLNEYKEGLEEQLKITRNHFTKGDIYLILARLENNSRYYRKACNSYSKYHPNNIDEQAILYETKASLNCNDRKNRWIASAIESWALVNKNWRENILRNIQHNKTNFEFDTTKPHSIKDLTNAKRIIIGKSQIILNENDVILTQSDRVFRDWLSYQMDQSPFEGTPLVSFSERKYYDEDELRVDIGWHEGGWIRNVRSNLDIKYDSVVGTIAVFNPDDEKWYASDEEGIFRFEIPVDKIYYPTTRFLTSDIALIIDTHGINMLVEQAIINNVDLVMGCCDHPGKVKAALYLSERNISVICITDRFLHDAIGHDSLILGSPPMEFKNDSIIFGNRPIEIIRGQKIAVLNIEEGKEYPYFYYATPYYYFREINKTFSLNIMDYKVTSYNQNENLFKLARENNITIAGYRVFNSNDYYAAKRWLDESKDNKIILFHSASYPYGKLLMEEYPWQISFNDPNPYILE